MYDFCVLNDGVGAFYQLRRHGDLAGGVHGLAERIDLLAHGGNGVEQGLGVLPGGLAFLDADLQSLEPLLQCLLGLHLLRLLRPLLFLLLLLFGRHALVRAFLSVDLPDPRYGLVLVREVVHHIDGEVQEV